MPKDIEHVIADGKNAARLLEDEVFKAACKAAQQTAIEEWKRTHSGEVALREAAYFTVMALDRIERELLTIKYDGTQAQAGLEKLKQQEIARRPVGRATRNN